MVLDSDEIRVNVVLITLLRVLRKTFTGIEEIIIILVMDIILVNTSVIDLVYFLTGMIHQEKVFVDLFVQTN